MPALPYRRTPAGGTLEMIGVMGHGAMGTLGEAPSVEYFQCAQMAVRLSSFGLSRRRVKIGLDGEVTRMRTPLDFRVIDKPLLPLLPQAPPDVEGPNG
jgi:diacylglycerol kinase family enzyme